MKRTIYFYSEKISTYKTYKDRHVFSQWYHHPFTGDISMHDISNVIDDKDFDKYVKGKQFENREKWMMLMKDLLFAKGRYRDQNISLIEKYMINETDPKRLKQLGRRIKGFDNTVWDRYKFKIVVNGNYLQFSQDNRLKKILLDTKDATLVEASPYDKIWGIGFRERDADNNKGRWGLNLLGKALMEVREKLS